MYLSGYKALYQYIEKPTSEDIKRYQSTDFDIICTYEQFMNILANIPDKDILEIIPLVNSRYYIKTKYGLNYDISFIKKDKKSRYEIFNNPEIMFFSCNGIKTDAELNQQDPMIYPDYKPDYSSPLDRFKEWFVVINNEITQANNQLLAPGTLYRKELHKIIGEPNLKLFKGAADMEYWARMLLYEQKGYYHPIPLWLYRVSDYSLSNLGGFEELNKTIFIEYKKLWKEKMQ